jgi:hypothetical protein
MFLFIQKNKKNKKAADEEQKAEESQEEDNSDDAEVNELVKSLGGVSEETVEKNKNVAKKLIKAHENDAVKVVAAALGLLEQSKQQQNNNNKNQQHQNNHQNNGFNKKPSNGAADIEGASVLTKREVRYLDLMVNTVLLFFL